jgi:penicillin-binding protein 1A
MARRSTWRRLKKVILWAEILFILVLGAGVGIVGGAFYQIRKILPPEDEIDKFKPTQGTQIVSADGHLLARIALENRQPVELKKIPKEMQNAVIAIEDERFYQHSGLDYRGLARAMWQNLRGGDLTQQGGSTITQQLARNIYLSSQKTLVRKLKETMLAVQIERNWSKQQILEMYLNQIYFGSRAYGIQSAAKIYFGKDVGKLTLAECALLAGLPQRPSRLSPYHNKAAAQRRRDIVLSKMAEQGYITPERARLAKQQPIRLAYTKEPKQTHYYAAPYFVSYVVDQLKDTYGEDYIYKSGLTVVTTLNWKMQQEAEQALIEGIRRYRSQRRNIHDGALVCLDPHTGYIRAMVGGVDFRDDQYNTVTQARRQPGSAFKLFVYTAALDSEGWNIYRPVSAAARSVKQADGTWWTPQNHSKKHSGSMPMLQAFAFSNNVAAVNTLMQIGASTVADYARRMGIESKLRAYPSLALGSSEVTPLEITSAYGVFPARGVRAEPMAIRLVKTPDGELLQDNSPRRHHVGLQAQTIEGMNQLTRAVVEYGTGRAAGVVAGAHGKTGTTDDYTNAWFIGYTPDLVTGVWLGNRDNSRMRRSYGGDVCAPIWGAFMREAVKLNPKTPRPKPTDLIAETPRRRGNEAEAATRDRDAEEEPARVREPRERDSEGRDRDRETRDAVAGDRNSTGGDNDSQVAMNDDSFETEVSANENNVVKVRVCDESYDLATATCGSTRLLEFVSGMQPRQVCPIHSRAARPSSQSRPPAER